MSSLYYLVGEKLNLLKRARAIGTVTPALDANFPIANAYDDRPAKPIKFGAAAAEYQIDDIETQQLADTGMETWTDATTLTNWTKSLTGTGALDREAVIKQAGSFSARLNGGASGSATIFQDITVPAGEKLKISTYLRAAAGGTITLAILNLHTGRYYNGSTDAWQTAAANVASQTADAWTLFEETLQLESFAVCGRDLVTIRIQASNSANALTYIDETFARPAVSWLSIHRHSFGTGSTLYLDNSDDGTTYVNRGSVVAARPACYIALGSPLYTTYWRIRVSGSANAPAAAYPTIGEIVLGDYRTNARNQTYGWRVARLLPHVTAATATGEEWANALDVDPVRRLDLSFEFHAASEHDEVVNEWHARSLGATRPLVVAPVSTEGDVIFGKLMPSLTPERTFLSAWAANVSIRELPGAIVASS